MLRIKTVVQNKVLQSTMAALKHNSPTPIQSLLPQSYHCHEKWQHFLNDQTSSLNMTSQKASELLISAKDHAMKGGNISELDIDTLSLAIGKGWFDENELDIFERNILPAFRKGPRASSGLPSTSAIISRGYLKKNLIQRLKNVFENKKDFGVFPDHISIAEILDDLIARNNNQDAAFCAAEWMLQEDWASSKISNSLSLLGSWNRAIQLEKYEIDLRCPGEEAEEEEIIRLNFLINPYNDLHFDLVSEHHRVGKTLLSLGHYLEEPNCSLIGAVLFEDFAKLTELFENSQATYSMEALDKFEQLLTEAETKEAVEEKWKPHMEQHIDRVLIDRKISKEEQSSTVENFKKFKDQLDSKGKIVKENNFVGAKLTALVQKAVEEEAKRDVAYREKQLMEEWPQLRQKLIQQQLYEAGRTEAIANSRERIGEIRDKMETLAYFERKDEIGVFKSISERTQKELEEEKLRKQEERKIRRWKKPKVKLEEARSLNKGLYPLTGV